MFPRDKCDFIRVYLKIRGVLVFHDKSRFIEVDQVRAKLLNLRKKLSLAHLLQDF
jgi:hypothetical protein